MSERKKELFKNDCRRYCSELKEKDVTYYFMDMVNICLNYELVPPNFLFNMTKAFVCLNGISNFSENKCTCIELLQEQMIEFMIKRSLKDCKGIVFDGLNIVPKALENTLRYGLVNTIAKLSTSSKLNNDIRNSLENLREMLDLVKSTYYNEMPHKKEQSVQ